MTKIEFGPEVRKITEFLSEEMPALSFIVWDMKPFLDHMHNWRKNMIFMECDSIAVYAVAEKLGHVFENYDIYSGIKKPEVIFRSTRNIGLIVIVGMERIEKELMTSPSIEKMLVDLLYYSRGEIIPISLKDVVDLWEYYLEFHEETKIKFSELYRYATRRYLGWFVSILAYKLSQTKNINADARHIAHGKRNLEIIKLLG